MFLNEKRNITEILEKPGSIEINTLQMYYVQFFKTRHF